MEREEKKNVQIAARDNRLVLQSLSRHVLADTIKVLGWRHQSLFLAARGYGEWVSTLSRRCRSSPRHYECS